VSVALPTGAAPLVPEDEAQMTSAQLEASQDAQLLRALDEVTAGEQALPTAP